MSWSILLPENSEQVCYYAVIIIAVAWIVFYTMI